MIRNQTRPSGRSITFSLIASPILGASYLAPSMRAVGRISVPYSFIRPVTKGTSLSKPIGAPAITGVNANGSSSGV